MLTAAKLTAFVGTEQPARAKAFYRDVLGLRLLREDQFALVFDAGGTPLRIATVEKCTAAPYTVLGWSVGDIGAEMAALCGQGVKFERYPGMSQDDQGAWTSPSGAKVAWFKDPDGHTLSITEFPARRASDPIE